MTARVAGLGKDSVAHASQITALDKAIILTERARKVFPAEADLVRSGVDVILGR